MSDNKGYKGKSDTFAKGGGTLGRTKDFMKTPDRFRDQQFKKQPETDEDWDKDGGKDDAPAAKGKSLKPIKPRS